MSFYYLFIIFANTSTPLFFSVKFFYSSTNTSSHLKILVLDYNVCTYKPQTSSLTQISESNNAEQKRKVLMFTHHPSTQVTAINQNHAISINCNNSFLFVLRSKAFTSHNALTTDVLLNLVTKDREHV